MRAFQRFMAAAAALLLCLGLTPPARAEEDPSWDEVNAKVLAEYEMDESSIHAGYLNLVTGEEHYINGDEYAVAASMYKVPLCMYFAEHLADGSLDWSPYEEYFSYKDVQDAVLIDSSNENAMFLFNTFLDGYDNFRVLTAPYMGVEPGSESVEITMHNYYTAREFIHCLKLLYDEQERFPDIIPTMQQAMTDRFFKLNEPRFRIAQKPGWMSPPDSYIPILNDCAICFTTQPIALVMFTASFNTSEEFLTAWCTAMCEYAETLANKPAPTPEPTPTPAPVVTPEPQPTPEPAPARVELPIFVPLAAVGLFLLAGLILLIVLCLRYHARFLGLLVSLLLSASAMLLTVGGVYYGTVLAKPSGDPAESAARFLGAVCAGDYESAYHELRDYSDLGLGEAPASPAGRKIYTALHESFSYALDGECRVDKLEAVQPVRFTYLDLKRMEEAVAQQTQEEARRIVQVRSTHEVYDENNRYRPEIANEAYLNALDTVLQNAPDYYTEAAFELSLAYADGRWQVLTNAALLRALAGGIGY